MRDRQCERCSGRYIDSLAGVSKDRAPELADIRARSNSSELQGQQVRLSGGGTAVQGYRRLYGDDARVPTVNRPPTAPTKSSATQNRPTAKKAPTKKAPAKKSTTKRRAAKKQ